MLPNKPEGIAPSYTRLRRLFDLPQVAERNIPRLMDVDGEDLLYHIFASHRNSLSFNNSSVVE